MEDKELELFQRSITTLERNISELSTLLQANKEELQRIRDILSLALSDKLERIVDERGLAVEPVVTGVRIDGKKDQLSRSQTLAFISKFALGNPRYYSGEDIKALRETLGLTEREFANKVGVSTTTLERWESDESKPQRYNACELSTLAQLLLHPEENAQEEG